jgi:hypothetical protein
VIRGPRGVWPFGTLHAERRFLPHLLEPERKAMNVIMIQPLIALIAGIIILLIPKILNYVIAIYLILVGLMGLFPKLLA